MRVDYIGAGKERADRDLVLDSILHGHGQQLVFLAPESVGETLMGGLVACRNAGRLKAVVIDEAHCVSDWGYVRPLPCRKGVACHFKLRDHAKCYLRWRPMLLL